MSERTVYFAYGSNLFPPQMAERCPECRVEHPAELTGYRLAFSGHSQRWGGGVATLLEDRGARVQGVLYSLSTDDLVRLNGYESYPRVYRHLAVTVRAGSGDIREAMTYQMVRFAPQAPSLAYVQQILRAYHGFGLDKAPLLAAVRESHDGKAEELPAGLTALLRPGPQEG